MKKLFAYILAVFLMSVSSVSFADDLKVGVLNFPALLKKAPQMEALSQRLKKEFKPRQAKIVSLQKSLEADQASLKRDTSVMSDKEIANLREKIANNQRDLRRLEEDYLADARAAQKKAMGQIIEKANKLVKKIAEEGQYDLILQSETVAYASNKIDITDKVIKELEKPKS